MKNCYFKAWARAAGSLSLVVLISVSCTKMPKPDFSYAPTNNPEAGMVIQFMNHTTNATSYSWDFGDGTTSGLEDPEHVYLQSGIYGVKLIASNEGTEKSIIKSVVINDPTVLAFLVTESTGQYVIPGASVLVYDNKADWDAITEPQFLGESDNEGYAIFLNMEPMQYYVYVVLEDAGGYWFWSGYTPALHQNDLNVYSTPCDWVQSVKKATFPYRSFIDTVKREREAIPLTEIE